MLWTIYLPFICAGRPCDFMIYIYLSKKNDVRPICDEIKIFVSLPNEKLKWILIDPTQTDYFIYYYIILPSISMLTLNFQSSPLETEYGWMEAGGSNKRGRKRKMMGKMKGNGR